MESAEEKRRLDIWYGTTYVDEYFRLLGGSGCYTSYCDCHVPALFTLAMDEWVGNLPIPYEHVVKDLIDHQMWTHTDQLPAQTLERVAKYQPRPEDIEWFTARVTERYPMTYGLNEKEVWQSFLSRRRKLFQR